MLAGAPRARGGEAVRAEALALGGPVSKAEVVREIRARRALMKSLGVLPRRRAMPRQVQPDTVRRAYFAALLEVTGRARELVQELLLPVLPQLVAQAAAARTDAVRADETVGSSINAILDQIADRWFAEFPNERLAELARSFGDRTSEFQWAQLRRQFRAALGVDLYRSEPWLAPKVAAFTEENVALIKSVASDYFGDLEKRLVRGMREGERWEDLAATVEERYGVSESRAKLIARDQTGKLYGDLNRTRQKQLGVAKYRWRTMRDNRVRSEHEDREGEEYDWNDPPEDGHPGEPVNCRCYGDPILDDLLGDTSPEDPSPAPASAPPPDELPQAALPGVTVRKP